MSKYELIKSEDLYYLPASAMHPADTYFHFSFANYYDPENMNFGNLRVLNDDRVHPRKGFGTHPHKNMEIFSYVVEGELSHKDSAGNSEVIRRGEVQTVSAGTGLTHSEINNTDEWCRFLQIWIMPENPELPINYNHHAYTSEDRDNKLLHIVSGCKSTIDAPLRLNQVVDAYVTEITNNSSTVKYQLKDGKQAYVYCIEGSIDLKEFPSLNEKDALKIYDMVELEISSSIGKGHLIIIEIEKS
jgi:redox-sensitive bicupin YhaK (pirin superfamily)